MTWIGASVLLIVSSVGMYLLIRRAQGRGMTVSTINFAAFLISCLVYLPVTMIRHTSLAIPLPELLGIAGTALFFSYLGNVFSLRSLATAPNPGYPLIISKSYVVFTTLVAVFFLGSELTLRTVVAIAIIILGSALITLPERLERGRAAGRIWIAYAAGAFFCWGFLALVSAYLLGHGLDVIVYLFYLTLFVSIIIAVELAVRRSGTRLASWGEAAMLLAIGIASVAFNLAIQVGYTLAPNPGYINAANASSIALLTLAAAALFHDTLTARKIAGVVAVTLGLVVLFL